MSSNNPRSKNPEHAANPHLATGTSSANRVMRISAKGRTPLTTGNSQPSLNDKGGGPTPNLVSPHRQDIEKIYLELQKLEEEQNRTEQE